MNIDTLRRQHPTLGFAIYAIDAGGPVTLEVYRGEELSTLYGTTMAECVARAFPEADNAPPPAPKAPPPAEEIDLTIPAFLQRTVTPPANVFD